MKYILIAALAFSAVSAANAMMMNPHMAEFRAWADAHKYSWEPVEEARRLSIFLDNKVWVEAFNAGADSFSVGMEGPWAAMTNQEYKDMLSKQIDNMPVNSKATPFVAKGRDAWLEGVQDDGSIDWRTEGAVTPVKNQGHCGSCWSFSTTDTLEGQSKIAGGELLSLSEQQFVDCSDKNGACNGGLMTLALDYAMEVGGVMSEEDYAYTGHKGQCQFDASKATFALQGYNNVTSGSEADLVAALQEVGPVAVAIDASHLTFQLYRKGVYNPRTCSKTNLDHGVGLVGVDYSDSSKPFLIVKNSWGAGWGLKGFINFAAESPASEGTVGKSCSPNCCGVASMASVANNKA